jgi:hypothetical protein
MYLHIRPDDLDDDVAWLRLLESPTDTESLQSAWLKQFEARPNLFFHEIYHYWQGLQLPFLYKYAVLSHRVVIQAYAEMAKQNRPLREWDCMLPELYRLSLPVRVFFPEDLDGTESTCFMMADPAAEVPANSSTWWDFTPQDLLETAASVSEFQVTQTAEKRIDPRAFHRWCKRRPAYSDAFEIASAALGESLALATIVPIVNGAFHTSDPCRGFIELLGILRISVNAGLVDLFLSYPEPRQWVPVVNGMLDQMKFESNVEDSKLLGSSYHRISLTNWLFATLNNEPLEHPFLTKKAIEWQRRVETKPAYSVLLAQPAWAEEDSFWSALYDLQPPLSFVKFHGEEAYQRVISTGDTDWPQHHLKRLLTIYSVVHRASEAGIDPRNRLCHHLDCPQYGPNYCNTYPAVPRDFTNCQFPILHEKLSSHWVKEG